MVGYNTDTHRDERRECLLVTAPKRGGLQAGRAGNCTRGQGNSKLCYRWGLMRGEQAEANGLHRLPVVCLTAMIS